MGNGNTPFEIKVNGDTVWTSGGDAILVDRIEVNTPRGQATVVGIPPRENVLDLVVIPRSLENLPLDVVEELKKRQAQGGNAVADLLAETFGSTHPSDGNVVNDQVVVDGAQTPGGEFSEPVTTGGGNPDDFSI